MAEEREGAITGLGAVTPLGRDVPTLWEALADSALSLTGKSAVRVGLVLGGARPGETAVWEGQRAFHQEGADGLSAGYIARTLPNAPAAQAAAVLGVRGPT